MQNAATNDPKPGRLEHQIDQLIWRLAKIEGDLMDLRRSLNAFRAEVITLRQTDPPDAA